LLSQQVVVIVKLSPWKCSNNLPSFEICVHVIDLHKLDIMNIDLSNELSAEAFAALNDFLASTKKEHDEIKEEVAVAEESNSCSNNITEPTLHDFSTVQYWDNRFGSEESYDWLMKYDSLRNHLLPYLGDKSKRILIVGCGNSSFSASLYDEGYENITNIDFSSICIQNMKNKHELTRPSMSWIIMDMTDLSSFENESFDIVIDKASMDAIMVDEEDVWHPCEYVIHSVDCMCQHISRVLKNTSGKFIQLSFMQPHFRTKYLMGFHHEPDTSIYPTQSITGKCKRYQWELNYEILSSDEASFDYFLYIMNKTVVI
jgi:2-polyprenyl-3-methyl-5-hydroxy-6-metoxy-1,4-benzoquinol methylase